MKTIETRYRNHRSHFFVREDTTDEQIVREVWEKSYYLQNDFYLKKNDRVLDVGAHIGSFSVLADMCRAWVWAFEPLPANYDFLLKNIALNNCESIRVFNKAITEDGRNCHLTIPNSNPNRFCLPRVSEDKKQDHDFVGVESMRFSDVIKAMVWCDFLKIDCEGYEYPLLYTLPEECFDLIGMISMEFHDKENVSALAKGEELASFLRERGYTTTLNWSYGAQGRLQARKF